MDTRRLSETVSALQGEDAFRAPLFPADWARLAAYLQRREFDAGTLLMRRGDEADTAYWIEAGLLQVFIVGGPPGSHRIARLPAGALVGEPALFGRGPRMAHVEALTPVVAWALHRSRLDALQADDPALALAVLRGAGAVMAARMRANLEHGIPLC